MFHIVRGLNSSGTSSLWKFCKLPDHHRLLTSPTSSISHLSSHQFVMTTTPFALPGIQFSSPFLRICPCHTSVKSTSLTVPEKTARAQWDWGKHSQFHCAASSKGLYLEQQRPKHDPSLLWGILCSEEGCMYYSLQLWPSLVSHSTDHTCGVGEVKYSKHQLSRENPKDLAADGKCHLMHTLAQ